MFSSDSSSSGVSIWGLVIFLLILFWVCGGGNGFGGFGCGGRGVAWAAAGEAQTDRDVLQLSTFIAGQQAATQSSLKDLMFQSERNTAAILEGQKDLYIRDLERVATQQFITSQTDTLSAKLDNIAAAGALQRQADLASINAQLASIGCQMLKAPVPQPIVGLATLGCNNVGATFGSCGSLPSCCNV